MRSLFFPEPLPAHEPPFETVNPEGDPSLLILCDHACNAVPEGYGDLGLPPEEFRRHTAYDIGARGVTLEMARLLNAPAVLSRFSRLAIDPNRGDDDPTLVRKISDGAIIPGNRRADWPEINRRLDAFARPYHAAVARRIDRALALGVRPRIWSIHSFTPCLKMGAPRPWHVGILWHKDDRLAAPLLAALAEDRSLVVGDNEPYTGDLEGDTMWRHGLMRGLPHVLIEVRQDLIAEPVGQAAWAARLAPLAARIGADLSH